MLSVSGGHQSKSSMMGRMVCGLQDEALQEAGTNKEMCYF